MFSYVVVDDLMSADHPIRKLRFLMCGALRIESSA
jgi:hypothetical protein